MMDFTSVYASGSGFARADTRFRRNTSPAVTAVLSPAIFDSLCHNGCPFCSRGDRNGAMMDWERGLPARIAGGGQSLP
jgi:hypothetical protein